MIKNIKKTGTINTLIKIEDSVHFGSNKGVPGWKYSASCPG